MVTQGGMIDVDELNVEVESGFEDKWRHRQLPKWSRCVSPEGKSDAYPFSTSS